MTTGLFAALTLLQLLRAPAGPERRSWLLALALVALATGLAALRIGAQAGLVAFPLYLLLIVAPQWLNARITRAVQAGAERRARWLSRLALALHPSREARERAAALPAYLALRAGDEVACDALDRAAAGSPEVRRSFDVVAAHNRRDVEAVLAAFADPAAREVLLAGGLGQVYVQAVGLACADGDAIAGAIALALHGDPFFDQPERAARLVILAHAVAGDVAGTRAQIAALGMYLEREESSLLLALAQWCSGDGPAARSTLDAGLARAADDRCARSMLGSFAAMLERRPPRPPTSASPALQRRLAALRRGAPSLAAVSTFVGRKALRPRLTLAWMAVLLLVHLLFGRAGISVDDEAAFAGHAWAWGALDTATFRAAEAWRLWTLTLLHAGGLHLALNLITLWIFGGFVEAQFGRLRLAAIYLLGAGLSGLSVVLSRSPDEPLVLVGASGAIMALCGAQLSVLLTDRALRSTAIGRAQLYALVVLLALQVVFDQIIPKVSGTAHASGIAAGVLLGALLRPRRAEDMSSGACS